MLTLPHITGQALAGLPSPRRVGATALRPGCHRQISPGKRCFDVGLALALAGPVVAVCILVALLLLVLQGRPVFYLSTRMTDPVRPFRLVKFRTMAPDPGDTGVTGAHKSGRITPVGAWLRRLRLDELPQLWNILVGEMSFVGPRPPLPEIVARHAGTYRRVLRSRPGVTGMATVLFHRHEEWLMGQCTSMAEATETYARRCIPVKARLDGLYERNRSLGLDIALLFWTVMPARSRRRIHALRRQVFPTRLTKKTAIRADDPAAGPA